MSKTFPIDAKGPSVPTPSLSLPVPGEPLPRTFARFREAGPVVPVDLPGGVRIWAVTTHAAIREVFGGDNKLFGKQAAHWSALREGRVPAGWPLLPLLLGEHMLMQEGAAHRRLRGLLSGAFTRARVEALRPQVEAIAARLLDRVVAESAGGTAVVDLVPWFTERMPMAVICELFGVPEPRRARLREWTRTMVSHASAAAEVHAAYAALIGYLGELVEEKRRDPGNDLTTALVRAHDDEDRLTSRELVDSLFLLLIAGHETSVHLLGHAIVNLLDHPDQLARARAGGLWDAVVEETLRLNPPISGVIFRYALAPVTVAGIPVAAGDALMLCIGGAATDPDAYGPDAGAFDIARGQPGHLAFGHGVHMCLGAPLARLGAGIALSRLFGSLPGIEPAIGLDEIPYTPSFLTYGPLSLPVRLAARP